VRLNGGALALAVLVLGFLGFVAVRHPWVHPWTPWQFVGVTIAVPAAALLVLARIQLGRAFSVKAKASHLVTAGIYARIRNPIYVFGGLWTAGLLIFLHRPWWLLIFVVLIPIQRLRVRKEEQVLEAKFGDTYREYKRKTWF
jgi:protein-S-isoprenylcysteine O-methyltransferase Ste14